VFRNVFHNVRRTAAVVTIVMAPAASAFPQITEAEALAELKLAIKTELATLDVAAKARGLLALEDLILALFSIDAGIADGIEDAVGEYLVDLHALADTAMRNLEAAASTTLGNLGANSNHFVIGGGGIIDGFMLKVGKGAFVIHKKLVGFLRKIARLLPKVGLTIRMTFVVNPLSLPVAPRPNLTAPSAPVRKLNLGAILASSDTTVADDGTLCAGGLADPAAGDVTVTITDPDGATSQQTVSVDGATGGWRACFSSLAEGNYTVDATQAGGQSASGAIGVP
jgi:hypothetical protein